MLKQRKRKSTRSEQIQNEEKGEKRNKEEEESKKSNLEEVTRKNDDGMKENFRKYLEPF